MGKRSTGDLLKRKIRVKDMSQNKTWENNNPDLKKGKRPIGGKPTPRFFARQREGKPRKCVKRGGLGKTR